MTAKKKRKAVPPIEGYRDTQEPQSRRRLDRGLRRSGYVRNPDKPNHWDARPRG